jgi:hypothetical protein
MNYITTVENNETLSELAKYHMIQGMLNNPVRYFAIKKSTMQTQEYQNHMKIKWHNFNTQTPNDIKNNIPT